MNWATLHIRGFKIKGLSIVDGNIVRYDNYIPDKRLNSVRQMICDGVMDVELCDYIKSIFNKMLVK